MVTPRSDYPLGLRDQRGGGGDRRPLSLLVLRDAMFGNRRYFRIPYERSEEGIASNILADRLRRLVAEVTSPGRTPAVVAAPNTASSTPRSSSSSVRTSTRAGR